VVVADGPGQLVGGRYRLVGRLGARAEGQAWRAYDEWLRVDVAAKHVAMAGGSADADAAEVRARTVRQAAAAARLRDRPHVAALYDVVVDGHAVWAVSRLVEGRSLADHLAAQGPLSVDRAADAARALLVALDAAYTADVVHRDVKPSNVLLAADGEVLLTDFGAAGAPVDPALAGLGVRAGTPGFVAPERIAGAEAGSAGDLFSLGVTLYQALEGRPPFDPADPYGTVSGELEPARRAGRLAPLLAALLARDPERRPSARAALALLDAPSDAVPGLAPAAAPPAGAAGWPARGATARLAGPFDLEAGVELHDLAFDPEGRFLAAVGADKSVRLWDLSAAGPAAGLTLGGHRNWLCAVAFSPDGRTLASGGYDRAVRLWDVPSGAATAELAAHTDWVRALAFDPDGRVLASAGDDRTVRLWDVARGALLTTLTGHPGWVRSLAFSPDGRTLAAGAGKAVQLWDVATARKTAAWPAGCGRVRAVAFSPDGRLLAAGGRKGGARVWDAGSHAPLPAWSGAGGKVRALAFSPDGATLATGAAQRTVTLWDPDTARELSRWPGESGTVLSLAFSPDGGALAATHGDRVHVSRVPPARYKD
jgi:hypothetical protein